MWFLNSRIDEDEVRRQVAAMAAGGIGGIQVAARTGLETPYLSEQWFKLVELIFDTAREHGLAVWLADEYPYPSGASGGEVVLRHPEYRAWRMRASCLHVSQHEEVHAVASGTVLLRACAVPVRNGTAKWSDAISLEDSVGLIQQEQVLFQPTNVYLTDRRYMSNAPRPTLHWRAPDGAEQWEVWLIAAAEITDYKFFGSYVDLCNPAACQLFLKTTYERYLHRLGAEKFAQLAGFFLDEAHPQNWSWQLPEFFRMQRGYDLIAVLPALWTDIGPKTARVRYDYRQSITDLFIQSFHRPVAEWCQAHGVALSLEVPSTRNLVQRYADVPGIDPGHDKVGVPLDDILARELPNFRGSLTFPASLAAQSGRQRVLDELFHSVGWSLTLQDMKAMLDRAAGRGANVFAFHAFCYTIGGLRKWDAPPSEFDQNPYWPHFPVLSVYAGRLGYALSRGRRVAPVALVDPITSVWAHQDAADTSDETGRRTAEHWAHLMRELAAAQRPYDNLDPLILAEATAIDGRLLIGDAEYQMVVLPSMTTLERAAWDKLEHFVASGGTVIATGLLPSEEIESASDVAARCEAAFQTNTGAGFVRTQSADELCRLLEERVPADLRLVPARGETSRRQFLFAQRRENDQDIFFLANSSMEPQSCEVVVRAKEAATVVRLDLETGQFEGLATSRLDGSDELHLQLDFPRHGAHLLLVGEKTTGHESRVTSLKSARDSATPVDLDLEGEWRCELVGDSLNALRVNRFRFKVGDNDQPDAPVVEPKPLINVFQDLVNAGRTWPGEMEVTPIFGVPPRLALKLPLNASYSAEFEVRYIPPIALLCTEAAAMLGEWEIWLNGHAVRFKHRRRWSVDNLEADVAGLLEMGPNTLLVRVTATQAWDGLVDAVYLLGDFAVLLSQPDRAVLAEPPAQLRWTERHATGYPYFSGTIQLSRQVSIPAADGALCLRLPDAELMFAGVAQLTIDGHALGVRAWAPYVWDVPSSAMRGGVSDLTLTLTTTLIEQLEGKRYDPRLRRVVPVEI
jgi:hypothetical protein